jgi:hypothetical protein
MNQARLASIDPATSALAASWTAAPRISTARPTPSRRSVSASDARFCKDAGGLHGDHGLANLQRHLNSRGFE